MYAVIMAGGFGTRFWPVSRRSKPKQLLDITGKGAMALQACQRLEKVIPDEQMIVIVGSEHGDEARRVFSGRNVHLVAEPCGRNSAPCVGLGAVYARHLGCQTAVAFLPSDPYIGKLQPYVDALAAAGRLAESGGIVTLGIVPTRPETGYGYIQRASTSRKIGDVTAREVARFVEKPNLATAEQYVAGGEHYWNAGEDAATPETILREIKTHLPELSAALGRIADVVGTDRFDDVFAETYADLCAVSFDYGIMEKTQGPIYVIPCDCDWGDVGSWAALHALRSDEHDANGNLSEGKTILRDCAGNYVSAKGGRLIACLGIKNLVVVDTPDALLIADLSKAQEVREIVRELEKRGEDDLL